MAAARVSAIMFSRVWNNCVYWLFVRPRLYLQIFGQQSDPGAVTSRARPTYWNWGLGCPPPQFRNSLFTYLLWATLQRCSL